MRTVLVFILAVAFQANASSSSGPRSINSLRCESLFSNSIAVRAKSMGTHVVDLEYRILKHLIKDSSVFRALADQVSPYQQWNIVSQLVPTFERRFGDVDLVEVRTVSKAFSTSRRQSIAVIDILRDLKQLTKLDYLRIPYLEGGVTQANESLRNFEYARGKRSVFTRVLPTQLNKRRLEIEAKMRTTTHARLAELEPLRSSTNEDVERLFTEWINIVSADESRTHDQLHHVEIASLALEKTASLVSALNRIEVANGQSFLTATRLLAKATPEAREAWTNEVLEQLVRKKAQLSLLQERLNRLERDLTTEPETVREAVDAEDARMQLQLRLQWLPLIDYWRQTITLKQAVFELQHVSVANGLTDSYLKSSLH